MYSVHLHDVAVLAGLRNPARTVFMFWSFWTEFNIFGSCPNTRSQRFYSCPRQTHTVASHPTIKPVSQPNSQPPHLSFVALPTQLRTEDNDENLDIGLRGDQILVGSIPSVVVVVVIQQAIGQLRIIALVLEYGWPYSGRDLSKDHYRSNSDLTFEDHLN